MKKRRTIAMQVKDTFSLTTFISEIALIYLLTSSGPIEDVGRISESLTSGWTRDLDDVRTTVEPATLLATYRNYSIRAVEQ